MNPKRNLISAAVVLAFAAAAATPAYAALERMGPVSNAPTIGGFPTWFQDHTGITMEFCDPKNQTELDGGWCVVLPADVTFPEVFPTNFFDEHFYYDSTNVLVDGTNGFKASLILALEAAFTTGTASPGGQIAFTRHRVFIPNLKIAGDYRVVTPFSDVTYFDQVVGGKIFDTIDVGAGCQGVFDCALAGTLGPFLLPSAAAGGAELPPMPDLLAAPAGTDPFLAQAIAAGAAPTADPLTGQKYIADPGRIGAVTGSPLPDFTAFDIDNSGATAGIASTKNHNTFRIEVRAPSATHDGHVIYVADGVNNFTLAGRLMTGAVPGNVSGERSTYKADAAGNVTDIDVFAQASPTMQARIPAQPINPIVTPVISFYDQACGGAITVDPNTGATTVNPGPYTAPAGVAHDMSNTGKDFWGQSSPGGLPPGFVCIVDNNTRNAAGQVVPAYTLVPNTDHVIINSAHYVGTANGTLTVTATSSDPTAVLTLAGYGPAGATTPGVSNGVGAGTGLDLQAGSAQVQAIKAPESVAQVVSSKGGSVLRKVDTDHGTASLVGQPNAINDSATVNEDCSATAATACAAGQGVTIDLLANDTVLINGQITSLRDVVAQNLATVVVTAQAPRLGAATVSADGILTYTPNSNVNGTDNVSYTVTVNGQLSNQAIAAITITPVNDVPVAANQTISAISGKSNVMNLLKGATDPDGNADVTDAVILTWPASLGAQPTPVNGSITFTPTATGNVTFTYQVKDAAGVLSANTATGTVTVIANETIAYTSSQFTINKARWVVSGTDTVRAGQQMTIVYADGVLRSTGQVCNGTAVIPECVVGQANVDATGTWLFDSAGVTGAKVPTNTTIWSTQPRNLRTFSSSPVLGGAQNAGIVLK